MPGNPESFAFSLHARNLRREEFSRTFLESSSPQRRRKNCFPPAHQTPGEGQPRPLRPPEISMTNNMHYLSLNQTGTTANP